MAVTKTHYVSFRKKTVTGVIPCIKTELQFKYELIWWINVTLLALVGVFYPPMMVSNGITPLKINLYLLIL
jgi:hypothetical protein